MHAILERDGKVVYECEIDHPHLDIFLPVNEPLNTRWLVLQMQDTEMLKGMGIEDFIADMPPLPPSPIRFSLVDIKDGIAVYRHRA